MFRHLRPSFHLKLHEAMAPRGSACSRQLLPFLPLILGGTLTVIEDLTCAKQPANTIQIATVTMAGQEANTAFAPWALTVTHAALEQSVVVAVHRALRRALHRALRWALHLRRRRRLQRLHRGGSRSHRLRRPLSCPHHHSHLRRQQLPRSHRLRRPRRLPKRQDRRHPTHRLHRRMW